MEYEFMQQPTVLIVALVVSIIVFMVTVGIVVSLFRAKDTFTDVHHDVGPLKKKGKIRL